MPVPTINPETLVEVFKFLPTTRKKIMTYKEFLKLDRKIYRAYEIGYNKSLT